MSHFVVMVVGNNVDEQLERFDENLVVDKYSMGLVSEEEKQRMIKYYESKGKGNFKTFDECYKEFGEDWNDNRWEKNNEGEWEEFSTYNPDSKWDWYQVGGRWAGMFQLKEGVKPLEPLSFSWGWTAEKREKMKKENRADIAYKRDIANLSEIVPFAILKDDEWYERGECGWWGTVIDDKGEMTWEEEVKRIIESIEDDELITMVDCHI